MKNFFIRTTIITATLLTSSPCGWGQDWSVWKYQAEVSRQTSDEPYCKLMLTPPAYGRSQAHLADLRLVGSDGSQIPYILFKLKDDVERKKIEPAIIDRSAAPAGAAGITVDCGADVVKNTITVETDGFIFRRAVKVEGSPDNQNYYTLVQNAYIFAVAHPQGVKRFSRVALPQNDFRYLKITVTPSASETQPLKIEQVTIERHERTTAQRLPVPLVHIDQQEDKEQQASSYLYDLQFANIPLTEVTLEVDDEAFYRYVTIEGRDRAWRQVEIVGEDNRPRFRREEVPWRHLSTQAVYRYRSQDGKDYESLGLSLPNMITPRFLKITIKNYDDKSLTVTAAWGQMLPHTLIFPSPPSKSCLMYLGYDQASPPKYDLALRLTNPQNVPADTAELGPIEANPLWDAPPAPTVPWTEQHKILFWLLLVLAVLILGVFIGKSLRNILRQPDKG
ncbi:MAG: hypothetical protein AMJ79_14690 [Phycisphaerae bacterium SM23_30]|nr:MAG: hypothetical protein AMJ79_14690 [Phycisphaerae bacterium SM23_30]